MQLHDFENDSDFRPSRAVCCLQIQVMLPTLRISLADYVQLPSGGNSYGQPSVIHITTSRVTAGS